MTLAYHEKCREWAKMTGKSENSVADAYSFKAEELADAARMMLAGEFRTKLDLEEAVRGSLANWEWKQH